MHRVLTIGGIVIALLAVVLLALPYLISAERFRPMLQAQLEKMLARPVELGQVSLRVIPLALRMDRLVIAEDRSFKGGKPFAEMAQVDVHAALFPLLRGELEITSIRLLQPRIELRQAADKSWNVASLAPGGGKKLTLGELAVEGGQVALTPASGTRTVYSNIDLTWRDIGSNGKMPIDVAARLGPGQSIEFHGTYAEPRAVDGKLVVKDCSVPALLAFFQTSGSAGGRVTGEAALAAGRAKGTLEWSEISSGKTKLRDSLSATFDAELSGDVVKLAKLETKLGAMAVAASGTIDAKTEAVDLAVRLPAASITSLAEMAALFGVAFAPGYQVNGKLDGDLRINGTPQAPRLSGLVNLVSLRVSGGQMKQPVQTEALTLEFTPDQVTSRPFYVQSGPTKLHGSFAVIEYSSSAPKFDIDARSDNADIADLIIAAKAYGLGAPELDATGRTTFQIHAQGPLKQLTTSGKGTITKLELQLPTLTKKVYLDEADVTFAGETATIDKAVARIAESKLQGSLQVKNFQRPVVTFKIAADKISTASLQSLVKPSKDRKPTSLTARGELQAGTALLNDVTLTNLRTTVSFEGGTLLLEPLTAGVYGGQINGAASIDLKPEPPLISVKARLEKIEAEQLLAATTPLRKIVTGPISGDIDVKVSPKPGEDFSRTLQGELSLKLAKGQLIPLNVLGEMSLLGKFLGGLSGGGSGTQFLGLTGNLLLKNGVAETQNLRLELDRALATFSGTMNLADQTLNLRMLTTLNKQFSEEVGGTRIGGYLSAAVASPKGELMMPAMLRGTFSKPLIAPDPAALGRLKLQGITGGGNPDQIREGVKGIIDAFRPKKKEN